MTVIDFIFSFPSPSRPYEIIIIGQIIGKIIDLLRIGKIIDENTLKNINVMYVGARWAMGADMTREFCTITDLNDDQHGISPSLQNTMNNTMTKTMAKTMTKTMKTGH